MTFDEGYDPKTGTQGTVRVGVADEGPGDPQYRTPDIGDRIENNNPEEYMRGFEDGRVAAWQEKGQAFFSAPASIRIEALRAAVQLTSGVVTALGPTGVWEASPASLVINYAEQFAAWLETGER